MQRLGDVHRSPLPRVSGSNPQDPVPKLVMFRFREEGHPVYLLYAEGTRNVLQYRETRHPEIAGEDFSDKIRAFCFSEPRRDRLMRTVVHIGQLGSFPRHNHRFN